MADVVTKALTGAGIWGVEFFLRRRMASISQSFRRVADTGMVTLAGTQNLSEFELHCRACWAFLFRKCSRNASELLP